MHWIYRSSIFLIVIFFFFLFVWQKRFEGTRVTVETFMAWKKMFDAEMAEQRRMRGITDVVSKKPTGKIHLKSRSMLLYKFPIYVTSVCLCVYSSPHLRSSSIRDLHYTASIVLLTSAVVVTSVCGMEVRQIFISLACSRNNFSLVLVLMLIQ